MNKYLIELDNFLVSMDKKELIYLYVMLVGGAIFLSYYFLFEDSEKRLALSIKKDKATSKEIREHKNYLSFHDDFEVSKVMENIDNLKGDIDIFNDKKKYINLKIKNLTTILYNNRSWTAFLNSISTMAKISGVEIQSIKNDFIPKHSSKIFQSHLKINISINSSYLNSLQFIDSIERSDLIVNVDTMKMALTEDGVVTQLFLSVWGIRN